MKKTKKISYISIIIMIMGGTIGAGIFFKNKTLSEMAQGHFGIVLATWGVGIFAMIALALALVEVTSAQKSDRGTLEWVKLFSPKWFHKSSSNYLKWIFIPITLFTMPLYVSNALEDAGLPLHNEWLALLFAFGIFFWFMIINLISLKFSEVSQWIFTLIQTIPLLVLPIYGLINAGDVQGTIMNKDGFSTNGLTGTSPWLATIAGISAIAFAYDGFYTAASLRNEMKDPKKIGRGLAGGIIGTSVIYLFLTIGFNVAGNGSLYGMYKFVGSKLFKIFNVFIAVGIMGIVNSFSMSTPRQFRDMSSRGELEISNWIQKIIYRRKLDNDSKTQKFVSAWLFIFLSTALFFIVLGSVSILWYQDAYSSESSLKGDYSKVYAGGKLYSFADTLTNFTSLLMFIIISTSLLGAIFNRKSNKVKVQKSWYFLPAAWIAVVINYAAGLYMIIEAIVNSTGYNNADGTSALINLLVFIIIIGLSVVPALFSTSRFSEKMRKVIKKHN